MTREEIDLWRVRWQGAHRVLPAVDAVLRFIQHELTSVVDRLSRFAVDLASGLTIQASSRENAEKLGIRIARLAAILRQQSASDWVDAARAFKGRHGKRGWTQTCWNVGMSDAALRDTKVVADRLDEAAADLQRFTDGGTAATLAHLARAAVHVLVQAADQWNTLMRWQKSADLAAKEHLQDPGPGPWWLPTDT